MCSNFNNNEDTKKTLKFYSDEKKEARITEYIESDNFNSDINYHDQSNITKTISLEQNTFKVNKLLKQTFFWGKKYFFLTGYLPLISFLEILRVCPGILAKVVKNARRSVGRE